MDHLTKLLDEARAKQKTMDDCLARTANDSRTEIDAKMCKYRQLELQIQRGQPPPDAHTKLTQSTLAFKQSSKESEISRQLLNKD
jgi:hypothetical protein